MKKRYETGSHHLKRKTFFNGDTELDMDIPDGDIALGKKVYRDNCEGCHPLFQHSLGPKLHNIFGKTIGTQKGYLGYSPAFKAMNHQWSKEWLFYMLENPDQVFMLSSNMPFTGISDVYERASLIEYLHHLRIHTSTLVKPEWINKANAPIETPSE